MFGRRTALALLVVSATTAPGCAKTEPAPPIASSPPAPSSATTSAGTVPPVVASPAAPEAGLATTPSPVAASSLDPRCAGGNLDLTRILSDGECRDGGHDGSRAPAGSLRITASAPAFLAPGAQGIAKVIFTNTTAADLDLRMSAEFSSVGLGGVGAGAASSAPAVRPVTVPQSTASADGKVSFDATWVMLGPSPSRMHVRLAPGGSARLDVTLRARGFLPGKRYDPDQFSVDDPPDPLPPGRYKVTLRLGIDADGVSSPVVDLAVHR